MRGVTIGLVLSSVAGPYCMDTLFSSIVRRL